MKTRIVDCDKNGPHSCIVETEKGSLLSRNRRDLMRTKETFDPFPDYGQLDTPEPVSSNDEPQSVKNTNEHKQYKTCYGRAMNIMYDT